MFSTPACWAAVSYTHLDVYKRQRYRVVEFPKRMLTANEILGPGGLVVPSAARDQVIAMVQRDNPTLPIRAEISEVAGASLQGRCV